MTNDFWQEEEVISVYSRKQAIEDGVLVDLTNATDATGHKVSPFKFPVAMTQAAFAETVSSGGKWVPGLPGDSWKNLELPGCQDAAGRLCYVFCMCLLAARSAKEPTDRVHFQVSVLVDGEKERKMVKLWSLCGPGDDAEPVITIMLEGED